MKIKLSVIMSVNRYHCFFEKAIDSILSQQYEHFEFLIICNGITDQDFEIIKKLTNKDKRIHLYRLNMGGLAFSLNFGIEQAQGEFIARMDSDDISINSRLAKQLREFDLDPKLSLVGTRVALIDENDNFLRYKFKFYETNTEIRNVIPYRNPIVHPSIMIKRDILIKFGGYKFGHMSEDHELFIRLARDKDIKFKNINEILFFYRRHKEQITDKANSKKHFSEISGFLLTEFLYTKNIKYILGIVAIIPIVRSVRNYLKSNF